MSDTDTRLRDYKDRLDPTTITADCRSCGRKNAVFIYDRGEGREAVYYCPNPRCNAEVRKFTLQTPQAQR